MSGEIETRDDEVFEMPEPPTRHGMWVSMERYQKLTAALEQVSQMEEALRFYADYNRYHTGTAQHTGKDSIMTDGGRAARQALNSFAEAGEDTSDSTQVERTGE